jgi:transcriptional regulator with XRE-family HTH domain
MNFGNFLKERRIAKRLTLRQCCAALGVDPSNWSKMERGVTPPPKDNNLLEKWADYLGVPKEKTVDLLDLASIARREIPLDLASDQRVLAAFPVFFRAVRGQELEGDRLKQFIEDLRAVHSPDKAQ